MNVYIKIANENELKKAISLSEKYCYQNTLDRSHGFTLKPINEHYFGSVYVVLQIFPKKILNVMM